MAQSFSGILKTPVIPIPTNTAHVNIVAKAKVVGKIRYRRAGVYKV
jgi:hypothetical protein